MHSIIDPDVLLILVGLALVAVGLLALARSRRWGAACTRCDWRHRTRSRPHLETAARTHAAGTGHDVVKLYVRGRR